MHKRHRGFLYVILVLATFEFGATSASASAGKVVIEIGKWLGNQLLGYAAGKTFDRLLGKNYEAQLKQVEANLAGQLRKGAGDTQRLRVELGAARSQLSMLNILLSSKPTSTQLEQFRHQLASDLARVVKVQEEHTQKITNLEKTSQDHEARLKRLEEREDKPAREEVEQPLYKSTAPSSDRDRESLSRGEDSGYRTQARQPRRGVRNIGATLIVRVAGDANEIDISETADFEDADIGSFEVVEGRSWHVFRLLADTGGVVEIQGSGNTLYLPRGLCRRIRVIRKGSSNRVDGCSG